MKPLFIFPSENTQDTRKEYVRYYTLPEINRLDLKAKDIIFMPIWDSWYICNEADERGQITLRCVELNELGESKDVKRITPEMKTAILLLKD